MSKCHCCRVTMDHDVVTYNAVHCARCNAQTAAQRSCTRLAIDTDEFQHNAVRVA
jgi:hypothetical protein